jgi:hypothetical protein
VWTIGVPFQAIRLVSGDGSVINVEVTVTDAVGRFTTVIDNSSARATRVVYYAPNPGEVSVPPGRTTTGSGARRWPLSVSFGSP